ncbi:MAG: hypothetical protein GY710_01010 [Desulfobacteraceae bacterium]|nr:hypothetical protein [Desulfobacteraceae bacterium]
MSDYGLIIKNSNNEIQIDSKYRNLSIDQSGSVTITNSGNGSPSDLDIIDSSLPPLFAWRPSTAYFTAMFDIVKSGSSYCKLGLMAEYKTSAAITYKIYRENRIASTDIYGLRIYNTSNQLCFDSGKTYLKIHSVHDLSLGLPTPTNEVYQNITHADVVNPYYILSSNNSVLLGQYLHNPPVWALRGLLVGLKKISTTAVRVGWFQVYNGWNGSASYKDLFGINDPVKLVICYP